MLDIKCCPYCHKPASVIFGRDLHPHVPGLFDTPFWMCWDCDAHVQVSNRGTMANKVLRKLRVETHKVLDPIWKTKCMTRDEVYHWLAKELDLTSDKCHIALMNYITCMRAYDICSTKLYTLRI